MKTRWVLPLLLYSGTCLGADYYVSTSGNDSTGDGSAGTPWATCAKAKTVAAAGDTVHVASGFYAERVTLTSSGTAGSPIQFLGPSDRSATNWGFVLNGANYITIGWFSISNSIVNDDATLYKGCGIDNEGSHNTIVSNNVFNNGAVGIFSYDRPGSGIHATNTLIQGNTVWSNVAAGIFATLGTGSTVKWNEVFGTMATNARTTTLWGDADGMQLFGNGAVIRGNYIHGLFWHTNSPYNYTNYTHVDGLQTWYHDSDPDNIGLQNCTVDGNVFDLTDGVVDCVMIQCCTNTTFYNNVMRGHRLVIITSQSGVEPGGIGWYNNTMISQSNAEAQVELGDSDGIVTGYMHGMNFTNNIFLCDSDAAKTQMIVNNYGPTGITGGHNLFYYTGGNVGNQTAYTFDATDIRNSNPVLTDAFGTLNFRIAGNSPAKDVGVTMAGFSADIYGTTRPQGSAWDIGAFEFSSGRVVAIWGISTIGKMSQ